MAKLAVLDMGQLLAQSFLRVAVDEFCRSGFIFLSNIADAESYLESFVNELKERDVWPFASRLQLDNKARVPHKSCQDAVETDHLSMHFEMGLPIVPVEDRSRVHALICLHIPPSDKASNVATRLLPIDGLLAGKSKELVEQALTTYVQKHGAGWEGHNSGRLLVAAQLVDAANNQDQLAYMREHRIAEWFNKDSKNSAQDGFVKETAFFARHNIILAKHEKRFTLKPGDLLIADNLRVAHGRDGKRPAEELLQFLYGVKDASKEEVNTIRARVVSLLTRLV